MMILALGLVIFLGLHSIRIVAEDGRAKAIAGLRGWPLEGDIFPAVVSGLRADRLGVRRGALGRAAPLGAAGLGAARDDPAHALQHDLLAAYGFKNSHFAVTVHHPMVWSVALWAVGHLLANGSAADLLLFGAFLLWAGADLFSAYAPRWRNAVVYPPPNWGATIAALATGVVLWGVLIGGLHLWLFGVSPVAM